MKKSDYRLWVAYHFGKINRKLTEREYSEIMAYEFAMHLLIPIDSLLEICGGLDNLKSMVYHDCPIVKKLAKIFSVPKKAMLFKIDYLIKEEKIDENKINIKKRILKKRR